MTDSEKASHAQYCKDWRAKKIALNPNFYKDEYYKNQERNKENQKKYYNKNTEKCLQRNKNWRKKNLQKMRDASNNWKKNNKEKVKAYLENNKSSYAEYARKRRAIKKEATIEEFSIENLDKRMSVFGYRCAYCGGPFEHVDHVKPLSKGGAHCLANLRPACASCNCSKHNKNLNDWLGAKK